MLKSHAVCVTDDGPWPFSKNHYPSELAGSFVRRQAATGPRAVVSVANAQQWDVRSRTGWRVVCEELACAGRGTAMGYQVPAGANEETQPIRFRDPQSRNLVGRALCHGVLDGLLLGEIWRLQDVGSNRVRTSPTSRL